VAESQYVETGQEVQILCTYSVHSLIVSPHKTNTALKYEVQIRHVLYFSLILSAGALHSYNITQTLEIIVIIPRGSVQEV
jgi:hypothetical protein